ncbi:unnamed protein product [Ambrosiozyma monospora]|uniref:Unnamed protein product n=1 Tax=Ambrosiozyma monospora TaxID=43982 RepID=A0ACB5TDG5_AMBMO|nr:unnamed protein product [Ambrosiozyma monospora]
MYVKDVNEGSGSGSYYRTGSSITLSQTNLRRASSLRTTLLRHRHHQTRFNSSETPEPKEASKLTVNELSSTEPNSAAQSPIVNYMSKFVSLGLSEVEKFIVSQSPTPISSDDQGSNIKRRKMTAQLYNLLNMTPNERVKSSFTTLESLSLRNQEDVKFLTECSNLTPPITLLREYLQIKIHQHQLKQEKKENISLKRIQKIQQQHQEKIMGIIYGLISHHWFHNASVIFVVEISHLNQQISILNQIFSSHPAIKNSSILITILALHLYNQLPNPLVLNQLDPFLDNNSLKINTRTLKMLQSGVEYIDSYNFFEEYDLHFETEEQDQSDVYLKQGIDRMVEFIEVEIATRKDPVLVELVVLSMINQIKSLGLQDFQKEIDLILSLVDGINAITENSLLKNGFVGYLIRDTLKLLPVEESDTISNINWSIH